METAIPDYFTTLDWIIVFGYLGLTTLVGHLMKGKQASIHDFFLGGRSLPWPAVTGSIIATEISGVTFIGVPGTLFAMQGDFTYLQWAIGSIFARVLVGMYFVRVYYEREIYSPYDYMGLRLGNSAKTLTTVLFTIGSILAQSVRVLVAALPLKLVTGMEMWQSIMVIGVFAIGWTLMGGMRTVIWTDVMQFILFAFGGIFSLVWIVTSLDGGIGEFWGTATEFGRTKLWDLRWVKEAADDKSLQFTFWVAIFAVPFQNLGMFGTDQLMAQRMFCCKNAKLASRAIILSSVGQFVTILMLLVGAALFAHYNKHPFNDLELATVNGQTTVEHVAELRANATYITHPVTGAVSNVIEPGEHDYVFPMWIVTVLPAGLSGLILAGVFAAAISSLDSILAALSQTTLSLIYHPERGNLKLTESQMLVRSRILVVAWGLILSLFTLLLVVLHKEIPSILSLAFGMTSYTVGPILAIFFAAMIGRGGVRGLVIGAVLSMILVLFVRTDVWVLLMHEKVGWITAETLAKLPTYELVNGSLKPVFLYAWMWPITAILTFVCGLVFGGSRRESGAYDPGATDPGA